MVHNSLMGGACATFFVLSMGFYNGAGERHLQYTGFDFDISGLLLLHGNTQQRERGPEALGNDRTWITARAFLLSFRNRAIKIWEGITMTASQPHGQEEEREDDEHTTRQRDTGRERELCGRAIYSGLVWLTFVVLGAFIHGKIACCLLVIH